LHPPISQFEHSSDELHELVKEVWYFEENQHEPMQKSTFGDQEEEECHFDDEP